MVLDNIDIICIIGGGIHVIAIGIGVGIAICIGSGVGIGKLGSCWSSGHCQGPAVVIGQRSV